MGKAASTKAKSGTKPALKKPTASFLFFTKRFRPLVLAAHPNFHVTDVSRHLSAIWAELTPEEKSPFVQMAEDDKARFERERVEHRGASASRRSKRRSTSGGQHPDASHEGEGADDEDMGGSSYAVGGSSVRGGLPSAAVSGIVSPGDLPAGVGEGLGCQEEEL